MNSLELQFIAESRELLEGTGEALLQFERAPEDQENLNKLFRQVHTLKGNSGLFEDLSPIVVALHAAEDTLDRVRSGRFKLGEHETDLLMEIMDFVVAGIDAWEAGRYNSAEQLPEARKLAERLRNSTDKQPVVDSLSAVVNTADMIETEPWFATALSALPAVEGRSVCVTYTPEPECFFKGEDPLQLVFSVPELQFLDIQREGVWDDATTFDFYRCQLTFRLISGAAVAQVKQVFEYVAEQVVVTEVSSTKSAEAPLSRPGNKEVHPSVLKVWAVQNTMLATARATDPGWLGKARAALSAIEALSKAAAQPAWAEQAKALFAQSMAEGSPEPFQRWLAVPPVSVVPVKLDSPPVAVDAEPKAMSVLKVPREKIDRLMELIGEMVVAKNALPYLASRAEGEFACRELAREIKANHGVINRIAEEMQDAIMQVRMLPVGAVFQRFPRLVRDLSKRLGKQVRLEISGEDTEADKNMIESLSEPLIHMLRNSLDHGIELPEVRQQQGKLAEGLVSIHAWQDSDRVYIRIRDDGAGVNPIRLKQKALEKGLLPVDKLEAMNEKELLQLIFLPGFSTANQISDVSGRGVGMDVVRSAIARVNGQVSLESAVGEGTTLTVSLPLSMAVNKVMVIDVAGQQFGIPMDSVVETVRVQAGDIHHVQDQLATVLRGKIIPLMPLHNLLGLAEQPVPNPENELAVLVCRVGHESVGVVVDDFDSTIDILLRPLDGVLAGLNQYSGSALLGDGTVLLILNLTEMMACQ